MAGFNAELDYADYIPRLDSLILKSEYNSKTGSTWNYYRYSYLKDKLLLQEIRQMAGLPFQRDTLLKYKKEGILGDVYFTDNKPSYYWYNDEIATNVIAYRLIKNDSLLNHIRVPMQMHFLSLRKNGGWNTYQSSTILMSILPDLMAEGFSKKNEASVSLSGKENKIITKFPYRIDLQAEEELNIRKGSGLPLYYMQYINERVTEAKTGVEGFEIKTYFSTDNLVLKAGEPVNLIVEVNVTKEANTEYVMIDVPIPGACSYADKRQSYYGVETHREYFKERTVIFCERMKSGNYTFIIRLLPRFTGNYILNPAQVSLMYIPVVNANTDMKRVEVYDQK